MGRNMEQAAKRGVSRSDYAGVLDAAKIGQRDDTTKYVERAVAAEKEIGRLQVARGVEELNLDAKLSNAKGMEIQKRKDGEEKAAKEIADYKVKLRETSEKWEAAANANKLKEDMQFQRFLQAEKEKNAKEDVQFAKYVAAEKEKVNDHFNQATMSKEEYRQFSLYQQYKKDLAEFEGNEEMKAKIAATYNAERMQQQGGGKDGMGLAGFGGKMIMARVAGMTAGDILGDQHGGRELGAFAGAAMFGGPVIATAVAGIELIGNSIKAAREAAAELVKVQDSYTAAVQESVHWTEKLAKPGTTAPGEIFDKRHDDLVKQREEIFKQRDEIQAQQRSPLNLLARGLIPGLAYGEDKAFGEDPVPEAQELNNEALKLNLYQDQAIKKEQADAEATQKERDKEDLENATVDSAIDMMPGGYAKQSEELDNRQFKEKRDLARKQEDFQKEADTKKATGAYVDQNAIDARFQAEKQTQSDIFLNQHDALVQHHADEEYQIKAKADLAELELQQDSYGKQLNILHKKNEMELHDYGGTAAEKTNIIRRQAAEETAIRTKADQAIEKGMQRRQIDIDLANGKIKEQDATLARAKLDNPNASPAEVAKAAAQEYSAKQASENQSLDMATKRAKIEADLARGKISAQDAMVRQMKLDHPDADNAKMAGLLALQEDTQNNGPLNSGTFGQFSAGAVNFATVNQDTPQHRTHSLIEETNSILKKLEALQ